MFGGEKREDDEGEGKRKRSAREAEVGSATPKRGGGGISEGRATRGVES